MINGEGVGAQMVHPEKWRDTIDPYSVPMTSFRITEVIGYPHARNDVFQVKGIYHGRKIDAYLKVARHEDSAIAHENALLKKINSPLLPTVIDSGTGEICFSVTEAMPGERLSNIVGDNNDLASLAYMEEYGAALASLHQLQVEADPVVDRRFFHQPSDELLEKVRLSNLKPYFADVPPASPKCFCHGDFHYANVLWNQQHISAILDFELSGYGNRDFDIAWSLFLRPGQRFLKTSEEMDAFLYGYSHKGQYHKEAVLYYMAQCYVYFLEFTQEDKAYCEYVYHWLRKNAR